MHYEICNRCRINAMCIGRQSECERWRTVYNAMEDELHKLIDDFHKAYDKILEEEYD